MKFGIREVIFVVLMLGLLTSTNYFVFSKANKKKQELAKKIVREIKDAKLKVQASIQGDAVRVSGAKKDMLQDVIALVRKSVSDFPLQFKNFRD